MAEVIYDKSKTSSQSTVKLDTGETVRAENVVIAAGETGGGGGGGGATSASQVSMTPLSIVNARNVQAGMKIVDEELSKVQDQVSVLTTSAELTTEIGELTNVLLDDLVAMDIDGRPSYKESGATVYAENGVVGIINSVDTVNQVAEVKTVSHSAAIGNTDGFEWTKVDLVLPEGFESNTLIVKLGSLPDGLYDFYIKNPMPAAASQSAYLVRLQISNGEIDFSDRKSFYCPVPSMSVGVNSRYYGDFFGESYPLYAGKIDGSFAFCSNSGYAGIVPGCCIGDDSSLKYFEVSNIKNIETGAFYDFESAIVYDSSAWYSTVVEIYSATVQFALAGKNPFQATVDLSPTIKKIPWQEEYRVGYNPEISWQDKLVLTVYETLWPGQFHVYLKTCRLASNYNNVGAANYKQTKFVHIITRFDFEIDEFGEVFNQRISLISPLCGVNEHNPLTSVQNCDGLGLARLDDNTGYIFSSCKGNSVFSSDFWQHQEMGDEEVMFAWSPILTGADENIVSLWSRHYTTGNAWAAPENGSRLAQSVPVGFPVIPGVADYGTGNSVVVGDLGETSSILVPSFPWQTQSEAANNVSAGGQTQRIYRLFVSRFAQTGGKNYTIIDLSIMPGNVDAKVVDAHGAFANTSWKAVVKGYGNWTEVGLIPSNLETAPTAIWGSFIGNASGKDSFGYSIKEAAYWEDGVYECPVIPYRSKLTDADISVVPLSGKTIMISGVNEVGPLQAGVTIDNVVIHFPIQLANNVYNPQVTVITEEAFKQIITDVGVRTNSYMEVCVRNADSEAVNNVKLSWLVIAEVS